MVRAGSSENEPIYIFPRTPANVTPPVFGLEWRVWAQGTSFYLATRSTLKEVKISLHGPRHPGAEPLWKVGYDQGYTRTHGTDSVIRYASADQMDDTRPMEFPGHMIGPAVRLAVRLRWVGEMFQPGAPSFFPPGKIRAGNYSGAWVLGAPGPLSVAHLDFYVSQGQPWWPDRRRTLDRNALMGPLRNDADQYLTAVHFREGVLSRFSEVASRPDPIPLPDSLTDRVRGLGFNKHDLGFLEVDERWFPRQG